MPAAAGHERLREENRREALSVALESFDYYEPDRATCRGDSGGAALEANGDQYVLAGSRRGGADKCDSLGIQHGRARTPTSIDAAILNAPPQPTRITGCCNGRPWPRPRWRQASAHTPSCSLNKEGHLRDEAASMINVDGTLHGPGRLHEKLAQANAAHVHARQAGIWAAASVVVMTLSSTSAIA